MAGVRAVVFDFGGVLITSISNQIGKVAADHDVEPTVMHEVLLGPRASGADHPWHRAERGEMAIADIQGQLRPWATRRGIELNGDEIERLLQPGEYTVVDAMIDRIHALRADGFATGLLTNTFAEFRPTMERDIDLSLFNAVVESFAVGARKPEPAIYAAAESMLGHAGAEIVYLDDFEQNLEPATALKWATVLVADAADALRQLDVLLR